MTAGAAAVRFGGMKAGLQIPESVHVRIEIHILNGLDLLLSLLAVNCLLALKESELEQSHLCRHKRSLVPVSVSSGALWLKHARYPIWF